MWRGPQRSEDTRRRPAKPALDQLEPDSPAGCLKAPVPQGSCLKAAAASPGIARAVASSCGRRVACILMFRALQCDDCGLCYRRGADGPLGRRSGCWYGCCLSE
jgi:hypothetical protein